MLYLLTRNERIRYDEYDSKVVRANSEPHARFIANTMTGDEGTIWEDRKRVTCRELPPEGKWGIILQSFNAG